MKTMTRISNTFTIQTDVTISVLQILEGWTVGCSGGVNSPSVSLVSFYFSMNLLQHNVVNHSQVHALASLGSKLIS